MANAQRVASVPAEELPADILRLASAIQALPDRVFPRADPGLGARRREHETSPPDFEHGAGRLSQLRLDMKYLMFDVEATRRERDEYHARLEGFES